MILQRADATAVSFSRLSKSAKAVQCTPPALDDKLGLPRLIPAPDSSAACCQQHCLPLNLSASGIPHKGDLRVNLKISPARALSKFKYVYLRIRPPLVEVPKEPRLCLELEGPGHVRLLRPGLERDGRRKELETFSGFTSIFPSTTSQEEVFEGIMAPLVHGLDKGKSSLLVAMGPTGAGKSHTVLGCDSHPGLLPRTLQRLFNSKVQQGDGPRSVRISMFEIYSEHAARGEKRRDLLEDTELTFLQSKVKEEVTSTAEEAIAVAVRGMHRRSTASTGANDQSSRSHCIVTIKIRNDVSLIIADLAGCEREKQTGNQGVRLTESSFINNTSMVFGQCLRALLEHQKNPSKTLEKFYQNSLLTKYLKNYMEAKGHMSLIVNVSPREEDYFNTAFVLKQAAPFSEIRTFWVPPTSQKKRPKPTSSRTWKRRCITPPTELSAKLASAYPSSQQTPEPTQQDTEAYYWKDVSKVFPQDHESEGEHTKLFSPREMQEALSRQKEAHKLEISLAVAEALTELERKHEAQMIDLQKQHEQYISELERHHRDTIRNLERDHEDSKCQREQRFLANINQLQRLHAVASEILQNRLNQALEAQESRSNSERSVKGSNDGIATAEDLAFHIQTESLASVSSPEAGLGTWLKWGAEAGETEVASQEEGDVTLDFMVSMGETALQTYFHENISNPATEAVVTLEVVEDVAENRSEPYKVNFVQAAELKVEASGIDRVEEDTEEAAVTLTDGEAVEENGSEPSFVREDEVTDQNEQSGGEHLAEKDGEEEDAEEAAVTLAVGEDVEENGGDPQNVTLAEPKLERENCQKEQSEVEQHAKVEAEVNITSGTGREEDHTEDYGTVDNGSSDLVSSAAVSMSRPKQENVHEVHQTSRHMREFGRQGQQPKNEGGTTQRTDCIGPIGLLLEELLGLRVQEIENGLWHNVQQDALKIRELLAKHGGFLDVSNFKSHKLSAHKALCIRYLFALMSKKGFASKRMVELSGSAEERAACFGDIVRARTISDAANFAKKGLKQEGLMKTTGRADLADGEVDCYRTPAAKLRAPGATENGPSRTTRTTTSRLRKRESPSCTAAQVKGQSGTPDRKKHGGDAGEKENSDSPKLSPAIMPKRRWKLQPLSALNQRPNFQETKICTGEGETNPMWRGPGGSSSLYKRLQAPLRKASS